MRLFYTRWDRPDSAGELVLVAETAGERNELAALLDRLGRAGDDSSRVRVAVARERAKVPVWAG